MTKLAIAATALIALVVILGTAYPSMATKDDNNGKALGCVNANDHSKVDQKNPHCGADLKITGPDTANTGGRRGGSFTVTVTNLGPATAENVVVTADNDCGTRTCGISHPRVTPDGTWDGTLAAGDSMTFTVTIEPFSVSITTSVSSDTHDPDLSNNSVTTTIERSRV